MLSMRRGWKWALGALSILLLASASNQAMACRLLSPTQHQLAAHTFVLVTVKSSERPDPDNDYTWKIVAERRLASGSGTTFTFETTQALGACGDIPLPPVGQRWVLYLEHPGSQKVAVALALKNAKDIDRRLAGLR